MRIPIYLSTIKFHFLLFFTYPLELVAYVLRYVVRVLFLLAFWGVVYEGINDPSLNYRELLSYFLLSTAISDIVMSDNTNLGRAIRKSVKDGSINSILIKPVNIIGYYYSATLGSLGVKNILSIFSIILALIINPPSSIVSVLLFFAFFLNAFLIAFSYNIFEGALSLIFTEVGGIKNAMHHITRLLSGQTIPFTFFPQQVQNILLLTPIPAMVFGPISVLNKTTITQEVLVSYLVSLLWGLILLFAMNKFWKFSLKKFDSAGN